MFNVGKPDLLKKLGNYHITKCHQHLKEEENETELFGPIWSLLTKYGSTTENVDMW
jgi:hypothetical protein